MTHRTRILLSALAGLLLSSCAPDPFNGPSGVKWADATFTATMSDTDKQYQVQFGMDGSGYVRWRLGKEISATKSP